MKKDLPKIIQRLDIPNAPFLTYRRCTDTFRDEKTRDYVTADYYLQFVDKFKIIE